MNRRSLCLAIAKAEFRKHRIGAALWCPGNHAWAEPEERRIRCQMPTTPARLALFLHEVGHCVNGRIVPVWYDEYLAWKYAMDVLRRHHLATPDVERIMRQSLGDSLMIEGVRRRWIRFIPDWLLREGWLEPRALRRRYARRSRLAPPDTWEPCPRCQRAGRSRSRTG